MDYGLFALAIAIGTIVFVLSDAGTSTARFVARGGPDSEQRGLMVGALRIRVVLTGLICALLVALASVIAGAYGQEGLVWPIRAVAVATFAETAYLTALGIYAAVGRTIVAVRLETAERLVEVSASVALVLASAEASGAAFGRAIGYAAGAVIAASIVVGAARSAALTFRPGPRSMPIADVRDHVASVFAADRSPALTRSVSVLLLGAYAGPFASGIFMAPAALASGAHYVGCLTAKHVRPRLGNGVPQPLDGPLRAFIVFQCVFLAPTVVWARPITSLLFGSSYSQSAEVLRALAPFVFFAGLAPLVARAVDDSGEVSRRVSISVGTLAFAVAAGFILIPRRGVVGAVIATDIAIGFFTLAYIWMCRRRFNLRIRTLVWALASALTAAVAMGIVLKSVGTNDLTLIDWIKGLCGGLAAYVAMLIFTREITTAQIARATSVMTDRLAGSSRRRLARCRRRRKITSLPLRARQSHHCWTNPSPPVRMSTLSGRIAVLTRRGTPGVRSTWACCCISAASSLPRRRRTRTRSARGSRCRVQPRGSALRAGRPCRRRGGMVAVYERPSRRGGDQPRLPA